MESAIILVNGGCSIGKERRDVGLFWRRSGSFVGEHPGFGAARALAFLAPDFFNLVALRGDKAVFLFLNLVEQQAACNETIHSLLAGFLTFHRHASRTVEQHDAGGNFVHVLSAMPAGADKGFLDVRLAHTERGHALRRAGPPFRG